MGQARDRMKFLVMSDYLNFRTFKGLGGRENGWVIWSCIKACWDLRLYLLTMPISYLEPTSPHLKDKFIIT